MNKPTKTVLVVGGGAAGWITAGRIAAEHSGKGISVILIESPNIPIVGVGEGTWPTMRTTLSKLKISETEFLRECDATFKQGAKFSKWVDGAEDDFYHHPLVLPQGFGTTDIAGHWQLHNAQGTERRSFSSSVCFQEAICEMNLAPKAITTPEYSAVANYAYHLNAGKFSQFLKKHCCEKLGVTYLSADVVQVKSVPNGGIESLVTPQLGEIHADLFVDCSGFSSLLLGQHLEVPFVSCADTLFIDTALAVQAPYVDDNAPVLSHTLSTAQDAGWIWDIGLTNRRGIGYVYSSNHTTHAQAQQRLATYVGPQIESLAVRTIPITAGHRKLFWKNNCVAVGLSAGFLEPLEASALVLVEMSAAFLAEKLPLCSDMMPLCAKRFNQLFLNRWASIIDFLKLHYLLSQRTDNPFWMDNRNSSSISESLQELMSLWRYTSPTADDFVNANEVFPAASYLYVLFGMGFKTDTRFQKFTDADMTHARGLFDKNRNNISHATKNLPPHRELLNKIARYGLQPI